MGLDATLTKVNKKYSNYEEKLLDSYKDNVEQGNSLLESIVFSTTENNIHYLFKKVQERKNLKIDYDNGEEMVVKKEDLIFIVKYVEENIQSQVGLEKLNEDGVIINNEPGHIYYNKNWWHKELLLPLKKIIEEYSEDTETIFYGAWY